MTYVIDIDDTLIWYPDKEYKDIYEKYDSAIPDKEEIEALNMLFDKGNYVILHTGRNWDKYELTKVQMANFGIKHHELVMGKPQGIYIDKDSYKTISEYLNV